MFFPKSAFRYRRFVLAEDNKGGSSLKRYAEKRYHKGVEKGDGDDAEGVRDHRHGCARFGVSAVCLGEYDRIQSKRSGVCEK